MSFLEKFKNFVKHFAALKENDENEYLNAVKSFKEGKYVVPAGITYIELVKFNTDISANCGYVSIMVSGLDFPRKLIANTEYITGFIEQLVKCELHDAKELKQAMSAIEEKISERADIEKSILSEGRKLSHICHILNVFVVNREFNIDQNNFYSRHKIDPNKWEQFQEKLSNEMSSENLEEGIVTSPEEVRVVKKQGLTIETVPAQPRKFTC